jgi:hypothetical protein
MVTDDVPGTAPAATEWLQGEVRYLGRHEGTLRCWCTRTFATRLAANLLGIEPDEATAQGSALDAVREFLNVLCGQLVTRWHGTTDIYNLSIPQVQPASGAPPNLEGAGPRVCRLSIEGEPLVCQHVVD